MIDLTNVNEALNSVETERKKIQDRLEQLKQRKRELLKLPLPKADFIKAFIEEQSLRENELSSRLYTKYQTYIDSPMRDLKIRGRDDSPLTWPRGTNTIPPDIFHIIFGKQINAVIVEAIEKWPWPEKVGPTRAERKTELATIDGEISELQSWLDQVRNMFPGAPSLT